VEFIDHLAIGFSIALTWQNLSYCFAGVALGTLIGVLPGLGPLATIAMLLPITFAMPPVTAIIMLAGIYYGTQYGGSTAAILINVPGESASVVTVLDGHAMARQGRAGPALAAAAIGSFFAGSVATLLLAIFSPPLAKIALQFGPPEYFSLLVLGLIASVALASGSVVKALAMCILGVLFGLSGQDIYTGTLRLTFDLSMLTDGIDFVALAMGMFGICSVMQNLENESERSLIAKKVSGLILTRSDFRRIVPSILRGTGLGSVLGVLPGGGAIISSFVAYAIERQVSKRPEEFGKGAIEGVAGPEAANNAGAQTSFIPMLTLGIPSNPVMALMVAALIIQGITPGPTIVTEQPELFWGLVASMWIGNLMLVLLNLPMIGIWVRLLSMPYHLLFPAILAFCCIGVYSVNNNINDVYAMALFGIFGLILIKLDFEPAPLLLGFIIGPMLEESLRRVMLISGGDITMLFTRPLSAVLLLISAIALVVVLLPNVRSRREEVFKE